MISKLRDDIAEARQKDMATEAASKRSEEVLFKMEAEWAKVKSNWAWKKERTQLDLANAKKEVAEAMERFRIFESFSTKKAQAVANFQKLEEFFALYWDFG